MQWTRDEIIQSMGTKRESDERERATTDKRENVKKSGPTDSLGHPAPFSNKIRMAIRNVATALGSATWLAQAV